LRRSAGETGLAKCGGERGGFAAPGDVGVRPDQRPGCGGRRGGRQYNPAERFAQVGFGLVCIASTRISASSRPGHGSPIFTSGLLVLHPCCEHAGPLRHVIGFPDLGLLFPDLGLLRVCEQPRQDLRRAPVGHPVRSRHRRGAVHTSARHGVLAGVSAHPQRLSPPLDPSPLATAPVVTRQGDTVLAPDLAPCRVPKLGQGR
jgi:hypothetical protein